MIKSDQGGYPDTVDEVRRDLMEMAEISHGDFQSRLIPTMKREKILGIRVPNLRAYARKMGREDPKRAATFLDSLPHRYFDEDNLHAFFIEGIRDYDEAMRRTELFLPHIDNWATTDSFSPRVFRNHPKRVYQNIMRWMESEHVYTVRYGIGLLLSNYLDENFSLESMERVAGLDSDEYYIRMMVAWYFATALVKQRPAAMNVLEGEILDPWVHNKAIQKAIESRRIEEEMKSQLRGMKRKL